MFPARLSMCVLFRQTHQNTHLLWNPMPNLRHYSIRKLNPFSGTAQVVELENTRAISSDGLNWQLQISNEIVHKPWSELRVYGQSDQYLKYGSWSKSSGLVALPVHPTLYQDNIEQNIHSLTTELLAVIPMLPFHPRDKYELWLLDPKHKPIVLLKSSIDHRALSLPQNTTWYPFDIEDSGSNAELSRIMQKRLGTHPACVWLKRDEHKNGNLILSRPKQLIKNHSFISCKHFPELMLASRWDSDTANNLVANYISSQSPKLLTLDTLSDKTRKKLEVCAEHYPDLVEKFHRLYPKVMDSVLLKKILVEARMRKALI